MAKALSNSDNTRIQNQLNVINEIRRNGLISNAELARIFQVPPSSTLRILTGLELLGMIRKSSDQKEVKTVGKPPVYFELSPGCAGVIAGDIGMHFTRFAFIDYADQVSLYSEKETQEYAEDFAEGFAEEINSLIDQVGRSADNLIVVLGVSGCISENKLRAMFLPENYNLYEKLSVLIKPKLFIENDANLAVIAEKNAAQIYSPTSILCILDRLELGTGIVIDGKLYKGFNGLAGETYRNKEKRQQEGMAGVFASDTAKDYLADDLVPMKHSSLYSKVLEAAKQGNDKAILFLEEILATLVVECVKRVRMLDPEVLIFAGEMAKAGKDFQQELLLKLEVAQHKGNYFVMPRIIFSQLGDKSVLTGAGCVGLNILNSKILTRSPSH